MAKAYGGNFGQAVQLLVSALSIKIVENILGLGRILVKCMEEKMFKHRFLPFPSVYA